VPDASFLLVKRRLRNASASKPSTSQMLTNENGQSRRLQYTQASASTARRRAWKLRRRRPSSMQRTASSSTASMSARGPDVSPFHRAPTDICAGRTPDVSQDAVSNSPMMARSSFMLATIQAASPAHDGTGVRLRLEPRQETVGAMTAEARCHAPRHTPRTPPYASLAPRQSRALDHADGQGYAARMAKFPTDVDESVTIAVPRERVYAYLWDVVDSSRCVPDLATCERVGPDTYRFVSRERSAG